MAPAIPEARKVVMMRSLMVSALALLASTSPVYAQSGKNPATSAESAAVAASASRYNFADIADLADHAPMVLDATIRTASKVDKPFTADGGVVRQRYFIEADISALIRASQAMPKQISYLVDIPLDSKGKSPKLKKQRVLVFARAVPGKAGALQLVAPDSQLFWDATAEQWTRNVIAELLKPQAPARITGVSTAFHAPGSVTGAGETQIFLSTASGAPASLSVSSVPGATPTWSATFGELVNDADGMPAPATLGWYRLACGLPATLPASAFNDGGVEHRAKIEADYMLVRQGLGDCTRTRAPIRR